MDGTEYLKWFPRLVVYLRCKPADGKRTTNEKYEGKPQVESIQQWRLGFEATQQLHTDEVQVAEKWDQNSAAVQLARSLNQIDRHFVCTPDLVPELWRPQAVVAFESAIHLQKLFRQQDGNDDKVNIREVPGKSAFRQWRSSLRLAKQLLNDTKHTKKRWQSALEFPGKCWTEKPRRSQWKTGESKLLPQIAHSSRILTDKVPKRCQGYVRLRKNVGKLARKKWSGKKIYKIWLCCGKVMCSDYV